MKINAKQAAVKAGVSLSLICSLFRQGKIPASGIGCRGRGCWRIDPAEFDKWLKSCEVTSPDDGLPLKHIR